MVVTIRPLHKWYHTWLCHTDWCTLSDTLIDMYLWRRVSPLCRKYKTIRCYHSGSKWTWEQWQWRVTPHSPNLQIWSLTIWWFNVISRTLVGEYKTIRCYHSGSKWTWKQWQWRVAPHSPNFQIWSLTIWWFNVISRTLVGGGLTFLQRCNQYNLQPLLTGLTIRWVNHCFGVFAWW